jgi:hypothetical protein
MPFDDALTVETTQSFTKSILARILSSLDESKSLSTKDIPEYVAPAGQTEAKGLPKLVEQYTIWPFLVKIPPKYSRKTASAQIKGEGRNCQRVGSDALKFGGDPPARCEHELRRCNHIQ